ncbi:MAG: AAA family ATPase [Myxococcaceae bacterium]|nr:AAA family ATPase [Myxococcaceae bacterium]
MLHIPGYTLLGTLRSTGSTVLVHAIRDTDGLRGIIKTPLEPAPHERERYRREFGILQRLGSVDGIPKAHACEAVLGRPVLLLEEVQGRPLSELIGKPLELSAFFELALSLASLLAQIHRHGVIHKDIKPSNIIVTPQGQARLIDFGIATFQQVEHVDAVPASLIEGTLAYMSPEQTGRMNRLVDYRTDFYSLGVTFYELLTGSRPFQGRDALEWFHAHLAQSPRPPHELVPSIPPSVSAIVLKLLAKNAEDRFQGAEGLRADLARCQENLRRGDRGVFPLGVNDQPDRLQLPQRLYGRETQISSLLQGFERLVRYGRPELFLVRGYSGVGKSSVVQELHKPVVERRGFFLSGKFDQFQRDIPYATLAQAIRGLVQHLLAGSDEELARWRERLQRAWGEDGQVLVELIPQLELVVGAQPAVPPLPSAAAQHRFNRVFRAFLGVFATTEHPLVIFLDDLQWADVASLQLLQLLLTQEDAPPVLWIGAYRDNEVPPHHPLVAMEGAIREAGARVTSLQLEPLSLEHIQHLLTDSFPGAERELVDPLSGLVHEKTGGNPFFLLQLLTTLHQEKLLERTHTGGWRWDAVGVRARGYSDNVVDFLVGKLRQLPAGAQQHLRLAACVGNSFSLQMLTTLSGQRVAGEVEQELEPLLLEGLIARTGPEQYRFLHDRIHQAAHALLSPEERPALHLRIGRLLLELLSPEQLPEQLFEVVSHLNAGADLLDEPSERLRAARLNAQAGERARASMALEAAIAYFEKALAFLPGDPWETEPALTFKLRLALAGCELARSNPVESLRLVEELQPRAREHTELAALYSLKSELHFLMGDVRPAITSLVECLNRLGMPMSLQPSWEEVVAAHEEVWAQLGDRPIESLIDLPLMSDPSMRAVVDILGALMAVAYFTVPNLMALLACRVVSILLRHGNTPIGPQGHAWFGVTTSFFFKRYREGQAFGALARELAERHFPFARGRMHFCLEVLSAWTQPLSISLEHARSSVQHSLQTGDLAMVLTSSSRVVADRLSLGHRLAELEQECATQRDFSRKMGVPDQAYLLHATYRFVQRLRGGAPAAARTSGEDLDEEARQAALAPGHFPPLYCWYWLTQMQSNFMFGEYAQAREAGDIPVKYLWSQFGMFQNMEYHLYRALTLAALFERAEPETRREYLEAIQHHQRQLAEWAQPCPQNFQAPERMVAAELARITGRSEEASCAYEEAIQAARENGFVQYVAMANELAARFWRTRRAPTVFQAFARAARDAYAQWGAAGKVRQLDEEWSYLAVSAPSEHDTTSDTSTPQVDALTVVKAQQAISREIVLERLTDTLMEVALENAGAQRGALLLLRGDRLSVVASSGYVLEGTARDPAEAPAQALPWSLITYVKRTREPVLIGDATQPHPFSGDECLRRSEARSVLCLPLVRQDALSGVLYLENGLATQAFTPARLSLLEHLASQAAISIENARLYGEVQHAEAALRRANDELERRVEERTRELKQAQQRLVDTAREVGMSEVAANVLHNVGNVLTSTVINFETMLSGLDASRVSGLKKVVALLQEHRHALADFVTKDPRGSRLPEYLGTLSDTLVEEQARLREGMVVMGQHIEHIRAIVQVQQGYARTALLIEECSLAQLISDALSIQTAALQRHGVGVTQELSPVPQVRVDKHKVLQILINLISNAKSALDATPEGERRLRLRLWREGEWALIEVVDNGAGFSPELREKLFAQGFTTRKDGHGLGLHSSALAAQLLGGQLSLESQGPGQGATATLRLPLEVNGPRR